MFSTLRLQVAVDDAAFAEHGKRLEEISRNALDKRKRNPDESPAAQDRVKVRREELEDDAEAAAKSERRMDAHNVGAMGARLLDQCEDVGLALRLREKTGALVRNFEREIVPGGIDDRKHFAVLADAEVADNPVLSTGWVGNDVVHHQSGGGQGVPVSHSGRSGELNFVRGYSQNLICPIG